MANATTTTIGLDLGDRRSSFCVLGASGEVLKEGQVDTDQPSLGAFLGGRERSTVVCETGTHSPWVSRLIEACGHVPLVASARQIRAISTADFKSDRSDAETLARLCRADLELLKPVEHRSEEAQADLMVIRSRAALVEARTKLVNTVRSLMKNHGTPAPRCSTVRFARVVAPHVGQELRPAIFPMLEIIDQLGEQIGGLKVEIDELCEKYPETVRVRQIPGVGPLTALAFVLTLERAERFARSRDVGPYLGLVPRRRQSGNQDVRGRITKAGDGYVRKLLVQAAHRVLGSKGQDTTLRRWGHARIASGGQAVKKRIVVAVARKLGVLMHALWRTGEVYEPLRGVPHAD